jgi:5-methylcytosine-specific restriction endonuclease McrA
MRGLTSDRVHAALYASREWRELRAAVLALNPWCRCADCAASGRYHKATVVHHREPHAGDPRKFFDVANLQALAKGCHDRLTARTSVGAGVEPGGVNSLDRREAPLPRGRVASEAGGSGQGPAADNPGAGRE